MFEIGRQELLGYLEILSVATEKKSNELMALRGVRLRCREGRLDLAATDLALSVKIIGIPVIDMKEEVDVVVASSDRFYSILKASTSSSVKISLKESCIQLKADGTSKINITDVEEFPSIHVIRKGDEPVLSFPIGMFQDSLVKAASAVSSRDDEYLSHLNGICINGDFYASDAKHLLRVRGVGHKIDPITIVPGVADVFSKLQIESLDEKVMFYVVESKGGESQAVFEFGNVRVGSATYSRPFPIDQMLSIIKQTRKKANITVTVKRKKLLEVLSRASLFKGMHSVVEFKADAVKGYLETRCLMIEAVCHKDRSGEEYREKLRAKIENTDVFLITVNLRELQKIFATMKDDIVTMNFEDENSAFYISSDKKRMEFVSTPMKRN